MTYIWFDAEFSSLDLESASLLQVAALATDDQLNRIVPAQHDLNLFIRQAPEQAISAWVRENIPHIVAGTEGPEALGLADADAALAAYVDHVTQRSPQENPPILAGNSIHNDWHLARRLLPRFMSKLHYRLFDVSTLKMAYAGAGQELPDKEAEGFVNTYFPEAALPEGATAHDAYYDIQASAAELGFYRQHFFKTS